MVRSIQMLADNNLNRITNHWREIFDPVAQIFLNSVVASDASLTEATGARVEHPLVARRSAPGNKREEQAPTPASKLPSMDVAHPRPRYVKEINGKTKSTLCSSILL